MSDCALYLVRSCLCPSKKRFVPKSAGDHGPNTDRSRKNLALGSVNLAELMCIRKDSEVFCGRYLSIARRVKNFFLTFAKSRFLIRVEGICLECPRRAAATFRRRHR